MSFAMPDNLSVTLIKLLFPLMLLIASEVISAPVTQTAELDGQPRSWRLFVPNGINEGAEYPLVFNFHGTGSSPKQIAELNELETLAEQHKFIVVAPKAEYSYEAGGRQTWNVEQLDSPYDDVAFIKGLIAHLAQHYPIDTARIYATGFSGGARMSSRLACDLADTFAAIAPIAGVRFADNCAPARAMPVLTYHGTQDPVNHYQHQADSPRYWHEGVEPAIEGWVKFNGCENSTTTAIRTGITKTEWSDCRDDVAVIFYRSEQAGHTWPGSPKADILAKYGLGSTDDLPMSEIIWAFLKQYQRQ